MKVLPPLILLFGCVGCAQQGAPAETNWNPVPAPDMGTLVARVGSVPIYSNEVAAEALRSNSTVREALQALIELHLLAEKAHQTERFSPNWSDPEMKSALAGRLLDRTILPELQQEKMPEQALQALYQKGMKAFVHPRLVEVGLLAVFTGPSMKSGPRAERLQTAKALAANIATRRNHSPEEFESIAKDPSWRARNVSYRRTIPWMDPAFSSELKEKVEKLKSPGDTTGLMEEMTGFYLATYAGEKPAQNLSYTQVREKLQRGYFQHWQPQQIARLMQKLGEGHRVEIHPELLK